MTEQVPIDREVISEDLAGLKKLSPEKAIAILGLLTETKMLAEELRIKDINIANCDQFLTDLGFARQLSGQLTETYQLLQVEWQLEDTAARREIIKKTLEVLDVVTTKLGQLRTAIKNEITIPWLEEEVQHD